MSTDVTMEPIREASPRPSARITGVVYLLYFLAAVFGEFLLRGIVVSGDAAATANNILAHQPLFRLGLATGLIATAFYIAVTALFYDLFKPVNRSSLYWRSYVALIGHCPGQRPLRSTGPVGECFRTMRAKFAP